MAIDPDHLYAALLAPLLPLPAQIARCEAWNTQPTRRTVASILSRLELPVFNQFKANPETFVARASSLIKEQKATMIIEHLAQVQRLAGEQPHDHRGIQ